MVYYFTAQEEFKLERKENEQEYRTKNNLIRPLLGMCS